MKHFTFLCSSVLILLSTCTTESTNGQSTEKTGVGGPCEGCEAIYEYGNRQLYSVDTLVAYLESDHKMIVQGTVYKQDGETTAKDVIIYIYHTNQEGLYAGGSKGWERRHGKLRGWVKTDTDGKYTFYTQRPVSYPDTQIPAHIHMTVKEPNVNEYYIDAIEFQDDPFVDEDYRIKRKQRGGPGIVQPVLKAWYMDSTKRYYIGTKYSEILESLITICVRL